MITYMTLERGVLFIEDGTEVSNVSVELLKAAPELLKALQNFVDPWSRGGDWQSKITYDTYNNARSAILKATGEQSAESPDLLAALLIAEREIDATGKAEGVVFGSDPDVLEKIRAAIAKATGATVNG